MSVISFSNQFSRCFSHNSGGFLSGARTGDPFIPCGQPTVVMYNTRDDCPQERLDPFIPCLPLHRATATVCFLPQLFSPRLRSKNVEFTRNRLQRPAGSIRESNLCLCSKSQGSRKTSPFELHDMQKWIIALLAHTDYKLWTQRWFIWHKSKNLKKIFEVIVACCCAIAEIAHKAKFKILSERIITLA